ncbi:TPA: flagellar export chaperone FliS [Salmonella enterica]|uniref:Flagellar secretion chaperone FliS n=1 Tax=Salmonella enterica TaxID=28901 RepID=A0A756YI80_SALER|nr:flagellar export chaperone FliS [Salmonella enterica subsp. enterica serovar Richmond]HAG0390756.1 flagellar export chaperone FliS [Salmonella enterica]
MRATYGSEVYAKVSLQSRLSGATPYQLITILFEGAHNAIQCAKIYGESGNIARRGEMISKAINIIDNGLRSALDHEQGGEIAENLDRLYEYMSRTLLKANLKQDQILLTHVDKLLVELAETWEKINPHKKSDS